MIIITSCPGQLGNQLHQFANILAYAFEYNHKVVNLALIGNQDLFINFSKKILPLYPLSEIPILDKAFSHYKYRYLVASYLHNTLTGLSGKPVFSDRMFHFSLKNFKVGSLCEPGIHQQITHASVTLLRGLKYQHPDLVCKHANQLRQVLRFNGQMICNSSNSSLIKIGLHMRLGDYSRWKGGRFFYTEEQYANIAHQLVKAIDMPCVVRAYSNVDVQKDIFAGLPIEFMRGTVTQDLCSMAECNFLAGPPSSFSSWASFIGQVPLYFIEDPNIAPELRLFRVNTDLQYTY
jgi:hypothetical protein